MTNLSESLPRQPLTAAPSSPLASHGGDDNIIDLGQLLATIWRRKWMIGFVTALAIFAGGYYAFVLAVPLFRSTAVVMLETNQESIVDFKSVIGGLSGNTSEVNSEVEILQSRGLIGKVVDRLELVSDPEFNGSQNPISLVDYAKDEIKVALGIEKVEVILSPEEHAGRTRDAVITGLLKKISVHNIAQSLVFQITIETENREKSARIADTLVELYIINQLEVKFDAIEHASTWLTRRLSELQVELVTAETEASEFSVSTELVSLDALQLQEIQLKNLRERIGNAEGVAKNAAAKEIALSTATSRRDQSGLANDAQLIRLLPLAAENDQTTQAFDARFQRVVVRAEQETTRAKQELRALQNSSQEMEGQIARRGGDLITLQQLTREAEAARHLYEYFLTRLKEISVQQGIQKPDSRILSNAVVPSRAISPKKSFILAVSGILGLMIGVFLALVRETRNNGFRTSHDLELHTGYTVLGQILQLPVRNRRRVLDFLSNKSASAVTDSLRNLRTSLLSLNVDNPPQVILLTSSVPAEGKTTISLALAQSMEGLGRSVLLIEGDIRRGTFRQYFKTSPDKGLISALTDERSLDQAVFKSSALGVDLLVGEITKTNAADLFASQKFRALIADARKKYDTIIIDTPPVLVVTDARIIAEVADAVLFTVHWDKTSKQQVDEALRMFHISNQRITGLVVSQINGKRMKQYGYGTQYGANMGYYVN